MPLDEVPEPAGVRDVRGAFVEQQGAAAGVRAEDRQRPHDPAHVGDPAERAAGRQLEAVRDLAGHLDEEAGVGVHRALRPAGRPGRVGEQQHVRRRGRLDLRVRVRRQQL